MSKILKRFWLLLPLLLLCAIPSHAQSTAFVQGAVGAFGSSTSTTCTFGSNTTATHLLVMFSYGGGVPTSITDTQSSTWHNLVMSTYLGATEYASAWYAMNTAGGAETITVNIGSSATIGSVCGEYSGVALTSALDQAGETDTGSMMTWTTGAATTTANNEALVVFIAGSNGSIATTAPFTQEESLQSAGVTYGALSDNVNQPIGTYTASGTNTMNSSTMTYIATFKAAPVTGNAGAILFKSKEFKRVTF